MEYLLSHPVIFQISFSFWRPLFRRIYQRILQIFPLIFLLPLWSSIILVHDAVLILLSNFSSLNYCRGAVFLQSFISVSFSHQTIYEQCYIRLLDISWLFALNFKSIHRSKTFSGVQVFEMMFALINHFPCTTQLSLTLRCSFLCPSLNDPTVSPSSICPNFALESSMMLGSPVKAQTTK